MLTHALKNKNRISFHGVVFPFDHVFYFYFPAAFYSLLICLFHYFIFALSACLLWILWTTFGQLLFSTFLTFVVIILPLQRRLCWFCPCLLAKSQKRDFNWIYFAFFCLIATWNQYYTTPICTSTHLRPPSTFFTLYWAYLVDIYMLLYCDWVSVGPFFINAINLNKAMLH